MHLHKTIALRSSDVVDCDITINSLPGIARYIVHISFQQHRALVDKAILHVKHSDAVVVDINSMVNKTCNEIELRLAMQCNAMHSIINVTVF